MKKLFGLLILDIVGWDCVYTDVNALDVQDHLNNWVSDTEVWDSKIILIGEFPDDVDLNEDSQSNQIQKKIAKIETMLNLTSEDEKFRNLNYNVSPKQFNEECERRYIIATCGH